MGRFIVVVLDSFGVGAMEDVPQVRPQDIGANTCKHILEAKRDVHLPNLRKLGLMNALGEEIGNMTFSEEAIFGQSKLMHVGGDTFYGHQEIMGTNPKAPYNQPFNEVIHEVYEALVTEGYEVTYVGGGAKVITVNGCVLVGDNLETDWGQVYNVSGCLDLISFEEIQRIGAVVRGVVKVSRVIALGGEDVSFAQLLASYKVIDGRFAGIDTPESGLYKQGYRVVHLGYGVDWTVQVPTILGKQGTEVALIGKVADIVNNPYGRSLPGVDSKTLWELTLDEAKRMKNGFICLNIQETDLAGHAQDVDWYADRLVLSDVYIGELMKLLGSEDILIVMADHGNDPTIGHSHHTREKVPVLVYKQGVSNMELGCRETLSDIGATAAEFFHAEPPENGHSFLNKLQ